MGTSKALMSKSTRIKIMIAIDSGFFLLELISGFLAHSLALTADAFHMVRFPILNQLREYPILTLSLLS
jgi:Co/Zn/Cd efflux system component